MIESLLMLIAVVDDLPAYTLPPADRLAATCIGASCVTKPSPYRIVDAGERRATSKDRAIAADGSYCSVVGAKRCTSRGRTILSTDFSD